MSSRSLAVLLLTGVLAAAPVRGDVYHLKDGDRITGRTVSRRRTSFVVKTPYGSLTIPRARVVTIVRDDGTEELINPPEQAPAPQPTPPPAPRLVLILTGHTFWHAWSPAKGTSVDPTLRLEVSLDEDPLAAYVDGRTDPGEIRGAVVNSFSFSPEDITTLALGEAQVLAPEARPGRVVLKIDLPPQMVRRHRLRLAYQVNEGSDSEPAWRDAAETTLEVDLSERAPAFVHLRQDRGRMEFSGFLRKKKMKNVETFRMEARAEGSEEGDGP